MATGEEQHILQPSLSDSNPNFQPETTREQKHKEGLGIYEDNSSKWEQGGDIIQHAALVWSVWELQSSGVQIWRWMINFGKGIERSKGDYLWAGKSPLVKCLFQHRSLQHSRWSFVSLSKPTDRWNDMGTGISNRAGSTFRSIYSPQCCVLLFKTTFKTSNIWNHYKKGSEK